MALTDLIDLSLLSRFKGKIDTLLAGKSDTGHKHAAGDITSGTLSIERGGTGGVDAAAARLSLAVPQRYRYYTTGSGSATFYVKTTLEAKSSSAKAIAFEIILTYGTNSYASIITGSAYWNGSGFNSCRYYDPLEVVAGVTAISSGDLFYLAVEPKGTYQYYDITVGYLSRNTNYVDSFSTTAPTIDYSAIFTRVATKQADKLSTACNLGVALGSTTAVTFDGSANQTSIPVSGQLAVANGGTGASTARAGLHALTAGLAEGTAVPTDDTVFLCGNTTGATNDWYYRKASKFWNYIKNKLEPNLPVINMLPSVYMRQATSGTTYTNSGITWTVNRDGSITATGTASAAAYFTLNGPAVDSTIPVTYLDPTKKYTLSGCPSVSTSSSNCGMVVRLTADGTTPSDSSGTTASVLYNSGNGYTFTGYKYVYIYLIIRKNYVCGNDGVTFYPMLEVGETAHAYVNIHDATKHAS